MKETKTNPNRKKSRSNSAFFLFPAICKALLLFALTYFMELLLLGLMPVWRQGLLCRPLWFFPIWSALAVLIWDIAKNRTMICRKTLLSFLVLVTVVSIPLSVLSFKNMNDYRMLRILHIRSEREIQKIKPLYPDMESLENAQVPLFHVASQTDPDRRTSKETLNEINAFISTLPEILLENTAGIYLMEDTDFQQETSDFASAEIFGLSDTSTLSVHIRLSPDEFSEFYTRLHDGTLVNLQEAAFYQETIVHELCHLLDYRYGKYGMLLSSSSEFAGIYEQKQDFFGNYATSSPAEFFAECGVYYYLYPQLMKEQFSAGYEYFKEHFPGQSSEPLSEVHAS